MAGNLPKSPLVLRLLMALAPLAAGFYALFIGQDVNWDLRNYHFYNPYAYLTGRMGYDIAVSHVATYYNPLLHVPFYWAVTALPPKAVGFILGLIAGFNIWLLYSIARQVVDLGSRNRTAWLCLAVALLGTLGAMNLAEIGTSYGDNIVSLPVLAAVWMVLKFRDRLGDLRRCGCPVAVCAGLLAGAAFGLKLPSGVYAVGLCAAFFGLGMPLRKRFVLAFVFGLGVLAGAALSCGFWIAEMWHRFQNPLFPYFNEYFQSPWGAIASYRDERFIPKSLPMWLFFPIWFTINPMQVSEVGFRDLRFPLLYILLLALLLKNVLNRLKPRAGGAAPAKTAPGRMPVTGFFIIFITVAFLLWMKLFAAYRYLMVGEMLAPLTVFLVLGALLPGRRQVQAAGVACILLLVTVEPGDWGRKAWTVDYFGFEPPAVSDPEHTIVLITGHDPMAYIIPFFPPQVRFLRIHGYVTGPSAVPNLTDRLMQYVIARHDGPRFILYRVYEEWQATTALEHYGLEVVPSSCVTFVPRVEPQQEHPFYFCEVKELHRP